MDWNEIRPLNFKIEWQCQNIAGVIKQEWSLNNCDLLYVGQKEIIRP